MLEVVQSPLARRLWRLSKFFQIPLNDERMQNIDMYDLEFYELSMIADDPKKLEQLQNHYFDPDFDDWVEEFEMEQAEKAEQKQEQLSQPEPESSEPNEYEGYDVSEPIGADEEWEEVN